MKDIVKLLMVFSEVIITTCFVLSATTLAFLSAVIAYAIITKGICQ